MAESAAVWRTAPDKGLRHLALRADIGEQVGF